MKPYATPASEAAPVTGAVTHTGDEAQKRAIADALWTEIHWLFPRDRKVTITVDGDDIAVEFGPTCTAGRPTAH